MRLLFVSHSLPPVGEEFSNVGGMQRVALDLHEALGSRDDVEYRAFVLRSTWRAIHWKVWPFALAAIVFLPKLTRREDTDIVLFSSVITAALALPLKNRFDRSRVKLATIAHGLDVTKDIDMYQRQVPKVFEQMDMVLPVSQATGEACLDRGLARNKMRVVPNGIRLDRFSAPESRREIRRELSEARQDPGSPLPNSAMLLCSVGRQVKRKGIAWFIDQVMPRMPDDVHYWVAGEPGPDTENIRAAISARGLDGRVRLLGKIPEEDLMRLYRGADLFVMPNIPVPGDMEGFGVVMLEAGACGLPTVASRLEGIQDVIAEGRNGYFAEAGDAEGFAAAIMAYYRKPEGLMLASRRALMYTAETFGWDVTAERYVEALRELVG